jgi:hypothetical protein
MAGGWGVAARAAAVKRMIVRNDKGFADRINHSQEI